MVDRCTMYAPLLMAIPPAGVTISCPIHEGGHFLRGTSPPILADKGDISCKSGHPHQSKQAATACDVRSGF